MNPVKREELVRDRTEAAPDGLRASEQVSEQRRTEEALRRSEEQLRMLIELAPEGIGVTDATGRYVEANAALCRMIGCTREEILGTTVDDMITREQIPRLAALRRAMVTPGALRIEEWSLKRRDGSFLPVEVSVASLPDGRRQAFVRDISERKRLEQERETALALVSAALEQCPVGLGVLTRRGEDTDVQLNQRGHEILGEPAEPASVGAYVPLMERPDGSPLPVEEAATWRALRGERVEPHELVVVRRDGARVPIVVRGAPLLGPDGEVQGGLIVFEDVTAEKELERLREEWTSVVAHDLQQPVAAIKLYAGLLDRVAARDPEARAPVAKIIEIATTVDRMIADLLDLSRAEIGKLPLWRRSVDVIALVRAAVERAALAAGDRALEVEIRGAIPDVRADPDRILQVLENLLTNAVKYGAPGTPIVVTVERAAGEVAIAVTNQGDGIAAEELPRIFRRFQRGSAARTGVKGTGLGLHIARELVEAHGGRLSAESERGGATTFRFTLPLG